MMISKQMEKRMRPFLWGDPSNGSLKQLIHWDTSSLSRDASGLGVGSLLKKNRALLAK